MRTDRGKEFLNRTFQAMLRKEGIQYNIRVCRDPNVKCALVERSHRTIREKLFKYMTYKNSYRYIDVLPRFVRGYNDAVHSATGMAPKVTDSDILAIWNRMRSRHSAIRRASVRFSVGQHVRIRRKNSNSPMAASKTTRRKYSELVRSCAGFHGPLRITGPAR